MEVGFNTFSLFYRVIDFLNSQTGYKFDCACDSPSLLTEIQKVFKYDRLRVEQKKKNVTRGAYYWQVKCKTTGCPFNMYINKPIGAATAEITNCSLKHDHTVDTPDSIQEASNSSYKPVLIGDLNLIKKEFQQKVVSCVNQSVKFVDIAKVLLDQEQGRGWVLDEHAKRMLRTWKDSALHSQTSAISAVHQKGDNYMEFLDTNYGYIAEEKRVNSTDTRFLFWSSHQQQVQYRRFSDVVVIDGTEDKNRYSWCLLLAVIIDSENKSQIVAQMLTEQETADAYSFFLLHLMLGGNSNTHPPLNKPPPSELNKYLSTASTSDLKSDMILPGVFMTDESAAFVSALKELQALFPCRMNGLRCHWHLRKNIKTHLAKSNLKEQVEPQWEKVLRAKTKEEFDEAWALLLPIVQRSDALDSYFVKTLYPTKERWATYCRMPLRTLNSQASSRVEGQNSIIAATCNKHTTLSLLMNCIHQTHDRQLITEHNLSKKANGGENNINEKLDHILNEAKQFLSAFAYDRFVTHMMASNNYDVVEMDSDGDDETITFRIIVRQSWATFAVQERHHKIVKVNKNTGCHTCTCHLQENSGIVCKHYFACMTFSLKFGLPFDISMIPRRWFKHSEHQTDLRHNTTVYCKQAGDFKIPYAAQQTPPVLHVTNITSSMADEVDAEASLAACSTHIMYHSSSVLSGMIGTTKEDGSVHTAHSALDDMCDVLRPFIRSGTTTSRGVSFTKRASNVQPKGKAKKTTVKGMKPKGGPVANKRNASTSTKLKAAAKMNELRHHQPQEDSMDEETDQEMSQPLDLPMEEGVEEEVQASTSWMKTFLQSFGGNQ